MQAHDSIHVVLQYSYKYEHHLSFHNVTIMDRTIYNIAYLFSVHSARITKLNRI